MASALSFTAWATASTSVLVIDRIASRSLTSVRPMRSSVVAMALVPFGAGRYGQAGKNERHHQVANGLLVGQVELLGRAERVREHDARHPLRRPGGAGATDVGGEERRGGGADEAEHGVEATEGDARQDQLGLVGEHELQRLV